MPRERKSISIFKIAEEAGVSPTTVSRVINKRSGIGEETRNKVNKLLRRYEFTPDYPAVSTVKVTVLLPKPDVSESNGKALAGIYEYASNNGLVVNLVIVDLPRRESLLELARQQQSSGIISILADEHRDEIIEIAQTELPVVVLDTQIDHENIGHIDNDSYRGAAEAMDHLLGLGHKKIGFLHHNKPSFNQLRRYDAYRDVLKKSGIEINGEWTVYAPPAMDNRIPAKNGYAEMNRLLDVAPEVTAVFAVDDNMALGAIKAIYERGLSIPNDISIVGFDDLAMSQMLYPSLTTVSHPSESAGYIAMQSICEGLKLPGKWSPPKEILLTELVIRKSTGPVKKF